jgi:hypothetical protein
VNSAGWIYVCILVYIYIYIWTCGTEAVCEKTERLEKIQQFFSNMEVFRRTFENLVEVLNHYSES